MGELGPSQLRELDEHVAQCDACRQATIDYKRFFQQVVPAVTRSDEEFIESRRNDIRSAVMRDVVAIDLERESQPAVVRRDPFPISSLLWVFSRRRFAVVLCGVAGAVFLTAGAFWAGAHFYGRILPLKALDASAAPSVTPPVATQPAPIAKPAVMASASPAPQDRELAAALDAERQRNAQLAGKLSVEDDKLAEAIAAQDALRAQIGQQSQALTSTKADLDTKTTALAQARAANSSDGSTIASLEIQVHSLTDKMNTETANLDRERDLLSHGREIRDIIGARNLHIIDIADTNTDGATSKPFARAFYTEGKSLVYYAYDLPQRRSDEGKYKYVAWGESNGNKASVKKIGILFHDDQTQRRWSLNFDNPQVLREIDSVFITLERNDEDESQPKGKRMLTAYLGTAPNHP
ncbi:MAG TPA: hypothetical protein VGN01_01425 [Acidobacteriaceae bacterium]